MSKNIVTSHLVGGLGNYLFQIAAAHAYGLKHGKDIVFNVKDSIQVHRGVDSYFDNILRHIIKQDIVLTQNTIPEIGFQYTELPFLKNNVKLTGYFQSDKYFNEYEKEIKKLFSCPDHIKESINKRFPSMDSVESCSIHVRRGDYVNLQDIHPVQNMPYFMKALSKMPKDCSIFVFSDDIEWCKNSFPDMGERIHFVEGYSDVEDLYLMSKCQPAGTKIMTYSGCTDIDNLKIGDQIISYSDNIYNKKLIGINSDIKESSKGRVITDISHRKFKGDLVRIEAGHLVSKYTPNHPCIVRLGNSLKNKHLVYLMQKGDKFRVGITSPTNHNYQRQKVDITGFSDPRRRFNAEKADNLWILKTFDNQIEALMEESYINSMFGIPQLLFIEKNKEKQIKLNEFWNRINNCVYNSVKCLEFYKRDIDLPFLTKNKRKVLLEDSEIILNACNLIPGMKVLDANEYKNNGGKGDNCNYWKEINIKHEPYDGLVYSIGVDINHTYVADGVVTHNCDHNIISNSTFSWWAAWLNENENKTVVAPKKWFGPSNAHLETKDIYPEEWEKI